MFNIIIIDPTYPNMQLNRHFTNVPKWYFPTLNACHSIPNINKCSLYSSLLTLFSSELVLHSLDRAIAYCVSAYLKLYTSPFNAGEMSSKNDAWILQSLLNMKMGRVMYFTLTQPRKVIISRTQTPAEWAMTTVLCEAPYSLALLYYIHVQHKRNLPFTCI